MAFGHPVPMSDLFGVAGRELLDSLDAARALASDPGASLGAWSTS